MGVIGSLMGGQIYLDTNIFIYALEGFPAFEAVLADLFEAIDDRAIQAVTSELALAEALVKPLADKNPSAVEAYERALAPRSSLMVLPISRPILRRSAELRAAPGGKLPDAIHVATVLEADCDAILSADQRIKIPSGSALVTLAELHTK